MCEIIDDCGLNACRTGDCVDKVNGYTCDCDEDHELMLQVNGSACVTRNVKISFSNEFRLKVYDGCDILLAESAKIHDTCIRPRGCVCGSMFNTVARAQTYPAQCNAASEQQPEGWRIVDPPPCLGGSTHRWVLVDTHSTQVPERDGCGWPK